MAGERTPEQARGDSTPVYGSFDDEESFELEESWEQNEHFVDRPVKEEKFESDLKGTEDSLEEPLAKLEDFSVADTGSSQVQGMCVPENEQATLPSPVAEKEEQAESSQSCIHNIVLAVNEDQGEEGSDLDTEEADIDQQPSVKKGSEGEEVLLPEQDLSLDSDSGPGSPEPLGLVEELQEEDELDWVEGNADGEVVLHCRKVRKLLAEEKAGEKDAEYDHKEKESSNSEYLSPGDSVKKFVVVDSCIFLSRLPLVKELLQEGRCTLYVCCQVVIN